MFEGEALRVVHGIGRIEFQAREWGSSLLAWSIVPFFYDTRPRGGQKPVSLLGDSPVCPKRGIPAVIT